MRRLLAFVLVSVLVTALAPTGVLAKNGGGRRIDKGSSERIATAVANGASSVTLLFATDAPQTGAVASALASLGAAVRYQDTDLGYIRAIVPVARVDAASKLAGVLAAEADEVIPLELPAPELSNETTDVAPPTSSTPNANPYMPTQDTGAAQFVAAHPTWDGRGVTIGQLDTGVDLGHPALQTTTTGERKIVDWVTMTDPLTDGDPTWIVMSTTVTVAGGTFTVGTKTYTGAPDGTWKYGVIDEASLGAASEYAIDCDPLPPDGPPPADQHIRLGADLNRDGVCDQSFAILWDGRWGVIVDSNADGSFAGEKLMMPYRFNYDIGEFGHDDPATAIRESVPFVVQVDQAANAVNIGIPSGEHATHVASILAGHGLFADASGPGFDGAAPGARLVSVRVCLFVAGCTAHALIEGMIFVEKNAHVDTVNMSIGGLPALNDGSSARDLLYNALIDKWGAQMFISAGNSGPGVNTIGEPSAATKVMSVGAYWSKASALSNYGAIATVDEALHDFSSRGPREDGGFKPDVVAPGNAVGAIPTWEGQGCLAYVCPNGYALLNGTSMAAPAAAGASALLISAAKQTGAGFKPDRLRQAMRSSARFIPNYLAHEQGFGLINVGAAWSILAQNPNAGDFTSSVATNTLLSGFLATPGVGTGIYDREGVLPGQTITRTYTFTRTDGGQGTFDLFWIGNGSGLFSANRTRITFDKRSTAAVDVTFAGAPAPGAYSAILVLDDPKTAGLDYATLNTVIANQKLDTSNHYTATLSGSARRFEDAAPTVFFQAPDGTTALRNSVTISTGRMRWFRIHPYGVPVDPSSTSFATGPVTQARTRSTQPLPGSWEIGLAASRTAIPGTSTFSASASAYKVTLDPASFTQDPATIGTTYSQTFTATNAFAAGNMVAVGSALASTRTATATITSGGAQQVYDIAVPAGSTSLTITIGGATDPGADLDLYVYDCTDATRGCVLAGSSTSSTANETVTIANPATGAWKAIVDPFAVPSGTTDYAYTDSIANPAFGSVSATDAVTARASGATWSVPASAKATTTPGAGRFFRGIVSVRLDATNGPILGSATFDLKNVAP